MHGWSLSLMKIMIHNEGVKMIKDTRNNEIKHEKSSVSAL